MHQDCNTYIKIRHINIKAHIYMFNELHLHQDSCTSYMKTRIPLDIKREESCLIVFGEWKYGGKPTRTGEFVSSRRSHFYRSALKAGIQNPESGNQNYPQFARTTTTYPLNKLLLVHWIKLVLLVFIHLSNNRGLVSCSV